jgi:hypothetical protein
MTPGSTQHTERLTRFVFPAIAALAGGFQRASYAVHGGIHHGPRQVVSANHLGWGTAPEKRVDRAQQAVAQIRLLPWLHGIDVRGRTKAKLTTESMQAVFGSCMSPET